MSYLLYDFEWKSNWERCPCGNLSELTKICQGEDYDYGGEEDDLAYYPDDYRLTVIKALRCLACKEYTVIRYVGYGTSVEVSHPNQIKDEPTCIRFERDILFTTYKKRNKAIPELILDVYNQAHAVIAASPRSAFILSGATLEEICLAHKLLPKRKNKNGKMKTKNLYRRLKMLCRIRGLSNNMRDILHGIRKLRNFGAHDSQETFENVTAEDAQLLLSLLDYVLDRLYIDVHRAKEAKETLKELTGRFAAYSSKSP